MFGLIIWFFSSLWAIWVENQVLWPLGVVWIENMFLWQFKFLFKGSLELVLPLGAVWS